MGNTDSDIKWWQIRRTFLYLPKRQQQYHVDLLGTGPGWEIWVPGTTGKLGHTCVTHHLQTPQPPGTHAPPMHRPMHGPAYFSSQAPKFPTTTCSLHSYMIQLLGSSVSLIDKVKVNHNLLINLLKPEIVETTFVFPTLRRILVVFV